MLRSGLSVLLLLAASGGPVAAFCPSPVRSSATLAHHQRDGTALSATRRSFVENLSLATLATVAVGANVVQEAGASGGATAGGVYLLSVRRKTRCHFDKQPQDAGSRRACGSIDSIHTVLSATDYPFYPLDRPNNDITNASRKASWDWLACEVRSKAEILTL